MALTFHSVSKQCSDLSESLLHTASYPSCYPPRGVLPVCSRWQRLSPKALPVEYLASPWSQDRDGVAGKERGGWRWQLQSLVDTSRNGRRKMMGGTGSPLCPTTAAIFQDHLNGAVCKCVPISLFERGGLGEWEGEGRVCITPAHPARSLKRQRPGEPRVSWGQIFVAFYCQAQPFAIGGAQIIF